jgi:hypothetical protein
VTEEEEEEEEDILKPSDEEDKRVRKTRVTLLFLLNHVVRR